MILIFYIYLLSNDKKSNKIRKRIIIFLNFVRKIQYNLRLKDCCAFVQLF